MLPAAWGLAADLTSRLSHHVLTEYLNLYLITSPAITMGSKQATIASFIETAPPGEVGRRDLAIANE